MTAQPFHPLDIPIHGTNLIEASAGTGKTWGIAALFTRLIVLEKMPVEQILVVTFTKAATAELKTRLRARLDEALQTLEILGSADEAAHAAADAEALAALYRLHSDDAPPDGFIFDLLHRALQNENLPRLTVRLKAAISQFDNAAIYTIHGFCQRLLRDYAFLCQAPFDTELAEHKRERLLTPAQDFWRTEVAADVHKARLVFKHRYTPENMLAEIQKYLSRPYLAFRRPEVDLAAAEAVLQQSWQNIMPKLPELIETFWKIHPALHGNIYRKNTFEKLFAELMSAAVEAGSEVLEETQETYVISGETNLLDAEDLSSNMARLRELFKLFEQKTGLMQLLDISNRAQGVQIFIGGESGLSPLDDCSVITAPYEVDGQLVGSVGVIGPTRMAYERVIPIVDVTARLLTSALSGHN